MQENEEKLKEFTFEVSIPIKLDGEFIESVLIGAFEGGSNYWISYVMNNEEAEVETRFYSDQVALGGSVLIHEREPDEDDPGPHLLTRDSFIEGYKKYLLWRIKTSGNCYTDAGDIDAGEADCILQFAIFGDVIYG